MKLLLIDTSGDQGFTAWSEEEQLKTTCFTNGRNSQLEELPVLISEHLSENGTPDVISVIAGPGSYTGLRVGLSLSKGLCWGSGAKLILLDTLSVIHEAFLISGEKKPDSGSWVIPMLDARRMEVFHSIFTSEGTLLKEPEPLILTEEWLNTLPEGSILLSDGAEKIPEWSGKERVHVYADFNPTPEALHRLSVNAIRKNDFVNPTIAVPRYTKAFFSTAKLLPEADANGVLRVNLESTANR